MKKELLKKLPKVDVLLKNEELKELILSEGKEPVKEAVNDVVEAVRQDVLNGVITDEISMDKRMSGIIAEIGEKLSKEDYSTLEGVINATGIVLHTNLGRAPIPKRLVKKLSDCLSGYMNLEYNLEKGARGERYEHIEKIICEITGAEAAMAVNNNASAVLLMCSAIGKKREIIVSRGEQIEIGGKFRIPDIIKRSNAKMIEVGTTNKTHLSDYEDNITDKTSAILKVHTSNYKVVGFTDSVEREDLVKLAHKNDIPVIEDLGSGVLVDLSRYGLRHEPTVQESVAAGVDLVSFSGDKLLGGTQAGIIVGKKKYIDMCKKHPLTRAMRIDKMQALLIAEIFAMYRDKAYAVKNIPVLSMLTASKEELTAKATELKKRIGKLPENVSLSIIDTENLAGGGSLPDEVLKGVAIAIEDSKVSANKHTANLRKADKPIIARCEGNSTIFELRTIDENEFDIAVDIIRKEFK